MILVTGCAGFIGFHLSVSLLKNNIKVIGIDNFTKYYDKNLKNNRLKILKSYKNFKFIKIDIKNNSSLIKKIKNKKILTLVHLAAQPGVRVSIQNPHNTLSQNLTAFSNIIELARILKIKKFLYASSSSVYGDTKMFPFKENDKKNVPVSIYGATKLCNEIIAEAYSRNFNLEAIGLRFFTVYGEYGRPDMAYYSFLNNLYKNSKITIFNKGKMHRDFTYIDDIIEGIINLINIKKKLGHCVINLGKGRPDKLFDLTDNIQKHTKKKFKIQYTKNIPNGDIKKTYADTNKAKKLINWKPKTSLKEGIIKFIDWYKIYYGKK